MSFWRNIRTLAARRAKEPDCATCPEGLPGDDPQFAMAVTALGAKLAKADGRADDGEFAAFSEVFQAEGRVERDVHRLYELARQTTRGFQGYARQLRKRYSGCPQLLEDVLDGLFHIAKSDGAVTAMEVDYLEEVAHEFGLSPLAFRRVRAIHLGAPADDPYVVLDVAPDAPVETIRTAWKKALSEAHPDRALGRGLPTEYVEVAQAKSAAINAAYDRAMRDRRELVGAGAA